MKFLIDSESIINWNGDISTLGSGIYYVVKKVETIRVIGEKTNSRREGTVAAVNKAINEEESKRREGVVAAVNRAINSEEAWRRSDVVEEKISITEIPNNDKRAGRIRYWKGLRYVENSSGKLERFPASDEPQKVDGSLFSGYYSSGKFSWNDTEPSFAEEVSPDKTEPEKIEKKKKKKAQDKDDQSVDELISMAKQLVEPPSKSSLDESPMIEESFDDAAFLDDIADPVPKEDCYLDSDKTTLIVVFEGVKYRKRFKTDKVAESQLENFKSLLIEDRSMAKELLCGSMSTFARL